MKKLFILVCLLGFNCKENTKSNSTIVEQFNFDTQIKSNDDINILNEGFNNGWEVIKDDQISILANRDVLYYVIKNTSDEQLKPRFYLHVVIKETEEFINLDFNFNEHQLEPKNPETKYKIASRKLPLKNILSITTGQVIDGKSLWEVYITDSHIY